MDTAVQTCYRHPDRRAGVICQRCDRPICPDCMNQASVGFHCPECTKQGAQKIVRPQQLLNARPVAAITLIAINVAVYVACLGPGGKPRQSAVIDLALVSVNQGGEAFGVANGEWYRLVTSGFLHFDLLHLGFNMFILYRLGQLLEPLLGRTKFVVGYFVAMMGGALGVMLLDPNSFTAGASGAVFGMMGVAVAVFRSRGIPVMETGIGFLIAINMLFTFTSSSVSVGGHLGGLIVGYIAGWILVEGGPRYLKDPSMIMGTVVALGAVCAGAAIIVGGAA